MRELVKSIFRLSWVAPLFGIRQMANLPGGLGEGPVNPLADAFEHVGEAASAELAGAFRNLYNGVTGAPGLAAPSRPDFVQAHRLPVTSGQRPTLTRELSDADLEERLARMRATLSSRERLGAQAPAHSSIVGSIQKGRLNTDSFVVIGEGLAAGTGDFFLSKDSQATSFPAQLAGCIGAQFRQPLFEPPGIGEADGFARWPVILPSPLQSTVLNDVLAEAPDNLAVPGFTVSDAVRLKPREPLIARECAKQTAANLILGMPHMALGRKDALRTQLECALAKRPTFSIVELGFAEALKAAKSCDVGAPNSDEFAKNYVRILRELRKTGATVLVMTVPNPFDTAYFSDIQSAARVVKLGPELLMELWHLGAADHVTVPGLNEIAYQLYAASIGPSSATAIQPLPTECIVSGDVASCVGSKVQALNDAIRRLASAESCIVYDLCALFCRVRSRGVAAGNRTLTGDYLGGFYSLNGYYPGATGNALIANEILDVLNHGCDARFIPIDLPAVQAADPVANYKPAAGPNWTRSDLTSPVPLPMPVLPPQPASILSTSRAWSARLPNLAPQSGWALQLPPGLEQVLPLNAAMSYFGDAISAQNCRTPQTIQWGSGGNLFFGGLAMSTPN